MSDPSTLYDVGMGMSLVVVVVVVVVSAVCGAIAFVRSDVMAKWEK
jgi:hypothetical protein